MRTCARRAAVVLVAWLLAGATLADMPPPELLAVGSIILADGQRVEGVMSVCRTGSRANPTDGMYEVWTGERDRERVQVSLFDRSFRWRHPTSRAPRKHELDEDLTAYYLRDVSKPYITIPGDGRAYIDESTTLEENGVRVLLRQRSLHARYELLDYVPIHLRLPAAGRPLGRPKGYRGAARAALRKSHVPNRVPLAEVAVVELLREPSDSWRRAIAFVMEEWWDVYDDTGDTKPPAWYHEVVDADGKTTWPFRRWRGWP